MPSQLYVYFLLGKISFRKSSSKIFLFFVISCLWLSSAGGSGAGAESLPDDEDRLSFSRRGSLSFGRDFMPRASLTVAGPRDEF